MPVPISCSACGSTLRIPDPLYQKRFLGRLVRLRCKKCQAVISVDGTSASQPTEAEISPQTPEADAFDWDLEPPRTSSATSLRAMTIPVEAPPSPELPEAPEPAQAAPAEPQAVLAKLPAAPESRVAADPKPEGVTPAPASARRPHSLPPKRRPKTAALLVAAAAVLLSVGFLAQGATFREPPAAAPLAPPPEPVAASAAPEAPEPAPEPVLAPEAPAPEAPPPAPEASTVAVRHHDEAALDRTLRSGIARAEACHLGGRATGTARVVVRFAPTGKVSSAVIEGEPIASAPVGRCVLTQVRAMLIPPFNGPEFEITREITLR